MKHFLITLISVFIFCGAMAQTKKPMTAQDSAAAAQAETNKFIDSLLTKTSVKEFQTFLYERVTGKEYNEGTFVQLYNFFMQSRYNEWMQKKKKP
jgi:abortive infection bacteriophage resistance protein